MLVIEVQELLADRGTVVIFQGMDDEGRTVRFAVDHRNAQTIVDILYEDGPFPVGVEDHQVLYISGSVL
jgi:hypothetical protein